MRNQSGVIGLRLRELIAALRALQIFFVYRPLQTDTLAATRMLVTYLPLSVSS